jgi:hypothetical protein
MKTMMKNKSKSEMINDLGFLPQTFVYGSASARYPSYMSEPRYRLRIEFFRMKQAAMGLFSFVVPKGEHGVTANVCAGISTCVDGASPNIL